MPKIIWKIFISIYSLFRLILIFSKNKNSILHFFLPDAYILGSISAHLSMHKGFTILSRRSMNIYSIEKPIYRWLEKILHKKTFYITANSKLILQELIHDEAVPSYKTGIIYNGVEDTKFLFSKENKNNNLVVTIVANLIPYKGHKDLLLAISIVKNRLPKKWTLRIVGGDPLNRMQKLKEYAKNLKISENIIWEGEKENIEEIWSKTDLGILCSHQEGFSNAIIEAMRARVPMIVTNVGGNSEAIIHNFCGLVIDAHNPHELGLAICDLANNPIKREIFGDNARSRYLKYFTLDKCINRYENLYSSILKNTYPRCSENFEITYY